MIKRLSKKLKNLGTGASLSLVQGMGFLNFGNLMLATEQTEFNIFELFAKWGANLLSSLVQVFYSWVFTICKFMFNIIDIFQVVVNKLIGIKDTNASLNSIIYDNPLFAFIINDTVIKVFLSMCGLGLVIIIVLSIIAIIKSEYDFATDAKDIKKDGKVVSKILNKSLTSLFLMLFTPLLLFVSVVFSSAVLNGLNSALKQDNYNISMGGQLFAASSYDANKYRIYAQNNQRKPIVFNFDDPYSSGAYKNLSSDHLASIYKDWEETGKTNYLMFQNKSFNNFSNTIVYKNNTLYNKYTTFGGYEKFVSTAEQYHVMADFIDYAVTNNLTYYIKNMIDEDIYWNEKSVNGVNMSSGVFDPDKKSLNISYKDISDLVKHSDFYNVVYQSGLADVSSPIIDTIETISMILGMAGNSDAVVFKMLERVQSSQNVVKWKTELAYNSNNGEFPVYKLTKRIKNVSTQENEVVAEVLIAQKTVSGDYYIVTEPTNSGYYEYTTLQIDYIQNDALYPDSIEPLYKYGTWPEKLYNDLKVIFKDINIDNFINYGTWADALGQYFNGGAVSSGQVATFSTSLIHPLGLIMSELFLGDIKYGDGITSSSDEFNFASLYMDETINSILKTVGTQYNYKNLSGQIEYFIELYNSIMKPILENVSYYESFNLISETPFDVYSYVYRSYLASMMLGEEFSNYFYEMASLGTRVNDLITNIVFQSNSAVIGEDGETIKESRRLIDIDGNYITNYYRDAQGNRLAKMVYGTDGNLYPTININGVLDLYGQYIVNPNETGGIVTENGVAKYKELNKTPQKYFENLGDNFLVYNYKGNKVIALDENNEIINNSINDYFTYESEEIIMVATSYTSFEKLSNYDKKLVEDAYNYFLVSSSNNSSKIIEEYMSLLVGYMNNDIDEILSVKTPNEQELQYITKNLDTILSNIELNKMIIDSPLSLPKMKQSANQRLAELNGQHNMYKKSLLVDSLKTFISNKMSEELTIVVNGKNYNVNVYTGSTKFYEYVLGNKLINTELLGAIKNQQKYTTLGKYDKITFQSIYSRLTIYTDQVQKIIQKLNTIKVTKYSVDSLLTEIELDVLNSIVSVFNNQLNYNLTNLNLLLKSDYKNLALDSLNKFLNGDQTRFARPIDIFEKYINNQDLTDIEYEILRFIVQDYSDEKTLHYVDAEYNGLVDENGNSWGILKEFLKNFGDLAFDLNNKSNLTSLSPNSSDDYKISDFISTLVETLHAQLYGFDKFEFKNSYSTLTGKWFNNLTENQQQAITKIYNYYDEAYTQDSTEFNSNAKNVLSRIISNTTSINFDTIEVYLNKFMEEMTDSGLDSIDMTDFKYYETTYFPSMSQEYQQYILTLLSIFDSKVETYNALNKDYDNSKKSIQSYLNNRFSISPISLLYTDYIPEYLTYFEKNQQPEELKFNIEGYTYYGQDNYADALSFYNTYLSAFNDVDFGINGVAFNQLTDLQQLILRNSVVGETSLERYFSGNENSFALNILKWESRPDDVSESEIEIAQKSLSILAAFVSGSSNLSPAVMNVIQNNLTEINTYKVFDFIGIEYNPDLTLKDYRIQAMKNLIDFNENIGEDAAVLQRRYLANLYLFISDYEIASNNQVYITQSANTKSIILELAGISNRPDETLVNLEYEVDFQDSRSDEQFGSIFIICTYDNENGRFVPFLFASGKNPNNVPVSEAYYSSTGEVKYYPVIAKGVFDKQNNPTAIREINGKIEFYRENITIVDASKLDIDTYYQSSEKVSVSFNPISIVINTISKLVTKKTIAENLNGLFPRINIDSRVSYPFGTQKEVVYSLDAGQVKMNYNFVPSTAIGFDYLYDIKNVNILVLVLGTIILSAVLIKAIWGLVGRLYNMVILFIISPPIIATVVHNDEKFKEWRENVVSSILSVFGYIVAINIFFLLIPITNSIEIFTAASAERVKSISIFSKMSLNALNGIAQTIFLFVGFLLIESAPKIIHGILGGDSLVDMGSDTMSSVKKDVKKVRDYASGRDAMDSVTRFKNKAVSFVPLYSTTKKIAGSVKNKVKSKVDVRKSDKIKQDLLKVGVKREDADKAAKAYIESRKAIRDSKKKRKEERIKRFEDREKARGEVAASEADAAKSASSAGGSKKAAAAKNKRYKK